MTIKNLFFLILFSFIISFSDLVAQGFLHTQGKYIYDGNNQEVILRGIGTGNWMLNEGYMMKTADFAGTHTKFRELLTETIGEENTETYYQHWLDNHFTRRDADSMKAWGFNSVRVAMHYKWLTLPIESEPVTGQDTWLEDGFVRLDSLLDWCGDNQMYLILDMHGAPGGQGYDQPISDYDPTKPSLWESAENRRKLTALWKKLAQRYASEPWMGGYDLINEPNWELPNGTLLKQTYVNITNAIREVDQNHMIIIEGNWFANDYTGLTPPWDDNIVYSFHKYWNYNTQESIQWMINLRQQHDVPIWLGETGENSNSWFTDLVKLAEANKIGWSWWPVKKAGINNVLMVPESQPYNNLLSYWQYGTPVMTPEQAFAAVLDWANNHKNENCTVQRDVIDALIRQPHSNATLPFVSHHVSNPVNLVNYDLGKCSYAYWDADTANYRLNTNVFTNWNEGWSYRNDGVDIQKCTDTHPANNGYNVGWAQAGEWLQFTMESDSAAAYTVMFRSASESDAGIVHLQVNGTDVCQPHQLPVTGGWQTWLSSTVGQVIIPGGTSKVRLYFDKAGSNVNFFRFLDPVPVSTVTFGFISGATNLAGNVIIITLNKPITSLSAPSSDFTVKKDGSEIGIITVNTQPGNNRQLILQLAETIAFGQEITVSNAGNAIFSDSQVLESFTDQPVKNNLPVRYTLPAKIQAEDFNVNSGFGFENCTDTGGGTNMCCANNGDYLDYNIYVPDSADYTLSVRVASLYGNGVVSLRLGNGNSFTAIKNISFGGTGGWQTWITRTFSLPLPKGSYTLRFYSAAGEYNINWFELSLPADVNEVPGLKRFNVYPNPSEGCFFVEAEFSKKTSVELSLYDLLGKRMVSYNVDSTSFLAQQIDDRELEAGVYIVCLSTSGGILSRKVVVN